MCSFTLPDVIRLVLLHTARDQDRDRDWDRDRDREMMGFCVTLCTVHTTQGQGQGQGIIVFYCARPGPCAGPVHCVRAISLSEGQQVCKDAWIPWWAMPINTQFRKVLGIWKSVLGIGMNALQWQKQYHLVLNPQFCSNSSGINTRIHYTHC